MMAEEETKSSPEAEEETAAEEQAEESKDESDAEVEVDAAETSEEESEAESEPVDQEVDEEQAPDADSSDGIRTVEALDNDNVPALRPGDAVSVHVLIREGDRERIQEFRGTIIRMKKGGNNANFTVRRTASHGVGVERTFLMRSPLIEKVEIQRRAHVRRAKLYYLRDRTGKSARLRERRDA